MDRSDQSEQNVRSLFSGCSSLMWLPVKIEKTKSARNPKWNHSTLNPCLVSSRDLQQHAHNATHRDPQSGHTTHRPLLVHLCMGSGVLQQGASVVLDNDGGVLLNIDSV